jgi:hypothetical protein
MLELWQTEWCPASRRIRQRLTEKPSPTSGCWNSGSTWSVLCMFKPSRFSIQS